MHRVTEGPADQLPTSAKLNPALEWLHTGMRELLDSRALQDALRFKAKFHSHSSDSALLIYPKRPDASLFDVSEALRPLVSTKGCTMSQFAPAWCVQQQALRAQSSGRGRWTRSRTNNLEALNVAVTDEDRAGLDDLTAPGQIASPFYKADFGPRPYW